MPAERRLDQMRRGQQSDDVTAVAADVSFAPDRVGVYYAGEAPNNAAWHSASAAVVAVFVVPGAPAAS